MEFSDELESPPREGAHFGLIVGYVSQDRFTGSRSGRCLCRRQEPFDRRACKSRYRLMCAFVSTWPSTCLHCARPSTWRWGFTHSVGLAMNRYRKPPSPFGVPFPVDPCCPITCQARTWSQWSSCAIVYCKEIGQRRHTHQFTVEKWGLLTEFPWRRGTMKMAILAKGADRMWSSSIPRFPRDSLDEKRVLLVASFRQCFHLSSTKPFDSSSLKVAWGLWA